MVGRGKDRTWLWDCVRCRQARTQTIPVDFIVWEAPRSEGLRGELPLSSLRTLWDPGARKESEQSGYIEQKLQC